jgi:hypothetical protein
LVAFPPSSLLATPEMGQEGAAGASEPSSVHIDTMSRAADDFSNFLEM